MRDWSLLQYAVTQIKNMRSSQKGAGDCVNFFIQRFSARHQGKRIKIAL
jgi:hypothetical protein